MRFFGSSSPPPDAGLPPSLTEPAPKSWDPDAAAERILFDRFWSSAGWRAERHTEPAQSEYAQAAGYLFGHATLHHDGIVERLITLRDELSPEDVGTAFADSLATGRLDLRSALGSYAAMRNLPRHRLGDDARRFETGIQQCLTCGGHEPDATDFDVLSFERFKWGGVRHAQLDYALFDLLRFRAARPQPSGGEGLKLLREILRIAASMPAEARASQLTQAIRPVVKGSADQRRTILACLGYAGVLQPAAKPGFFETYPLDRNPPGGKNDWAYPVSWWRGQDGVNAAAVRVWFPEIGR